MADPVVRVRTGRDLADLTRALRREADGKARLKELRKGLREPGKEIAKAVRGNIRTLPSKGESRRRGRKSLRAEMARSVTLQVRTSGRQAGVNVFMSPKKMPTGKKALPSYFERRPGYERLRHPVFGDRETWVQNQNVPPQGYFTRTIRPVERRAVEAVQRVIDETARRVEGS